MKKYRIVHNEVANTFMVEEKGWIFWRNVFTHYRGEHQIITRFNSLEDAKSALSRKQDNDKKDYHKVVYESDKTQILEDIYK